ncbi:YhcH/YjgK/YiaL family protein [Clostridium sp. YIM B02569]|uniref:YhcH/YjgK/YiaL family protein n=1 Tax=Clostridium sp. YIM B02569 TaxID=2911967 RepID=UPI001EEF46D6|nr:YhcH/YjgK/YiaL family protein [Clostridium sp. YIM B02569]
MIFGDLNHLEIEKKIYPAAIVKALEFLKNTDFNALENGTYEIQGNEIFAKIFETETAVLDERRPETHGKFIDIQYSLDGKEIVGFARKTGEQKINENLLENDDNIFYENDIKDEIYLKMNPGTFAIFFPYDVHRPACNLEKNEKIRKVVVKVSVNCM